MDYLMEALISDLLYAGHSMSHILDFFKRQQQEFLEHNDAEKLYRILTNLTENLYLFLFISVLKFQARRRRNWHLIL